MTIYEFACRTDVCHTRGMYVCRYIELASTDSNIDKVHGINTCRFKYWRITHKDWITHLV
jgi:hypothetical protein